MKTTTITFANLSDICNTPEENEIIRELIGHEFTWGDVTYSIVSKRDLIEVLELSMDELYVQSFISKLSKLEVNYINL